jgi:hypothetical protein
MIPNSFSHILIRLPETIVSDADSAAGKRKNRFSCRSGNGPSTRLKRGRRPESQRRGGVEKESKRLLKIEGCKPCWFKKW